MPSYLDTREHVAQYKDQQSAVKSAMQKIKLGLRAALGWSSEPVILGKVVHHFTASKGSDEVYAPSLLLFASRRGQG